MKITTTKDLEKGSYWYRLNLFKGKSKKGLEEINKKYDSLIKFLQTELHLNHFIPAKEVNGKWVVLEKPFNYDGFNDRCKWYDKTRLYWIEDCKEYQKAERKVLFKNVDYKLIVNGIASYYIVSYKGNNIYLSWNKSKTIQDLIPLDLELTQNVISRL